MKTKKYIFSIILLSTVLLLAGCSSSVSGPVPEESPNRTFADAEGNYRGITIAGKGKKLVIDATVSTPDSFENIYPYSAAVSMEHFEQMAEDLIKSKSGDLVHDGARYICEEDSFSYILQLLDQYGRVGYLDTRNVVSGKFIGFHTKYGTVVSDETYDVGIPYQEACNACQNFSEKYSDLTFKPYRSWVEVNDAGDARYRICLAPQLDGLPLCIRSANSLFYADISIGKDGISEAHGMIAIDLLEHGEAYEIMDLDSIISKLEGSIDYFMLTDEASVYLIALEYYANYVGDGKYEFLPVWSFYCEQDYYHQYVMCFNADDGSFCFSSLIL